MTKWLCIALALVACQPADRKPTFTSGSLRIHVAEDTPHANWQPMIAAGGEMLYVDPTPAMTERHLRRVKVGKVQAEDAILILGFNEEGTARLAEMTGANVGKRIAFVVNGRVVSAPRLESRIDGGVAVIEGGFTEEEATRLAKAIAGS